MEQKKQAILKRLHQLNEVSFVKPTAMDLHSKRAMLSRVQRKADNLYKDSVEKQKVKLNLDLRKVESYLDRVKMRNDYLARRPMVLSRSEGSVLAGSSEGSALTGSFRQRDRESRRRQEAYLKKTPEVSAQPKIVIGQRPILKRTRLSRHKRRFR